MSAQIKTFIDENGNQLLPTTAASAVYTLNGDTVENILNNLPDQIQQIINASGGNATSQELEEIASYIASHVSRKDNPHEVSADQT